MNGHKLDVAAELKSLAGELMPERARPSPVVIVPRGDDPGETPEAYEARVQAAIRDHFGGWPIPEAGTLFLLPEPDPPPDPGLSG